MAIPHANYAPIQHLLDEVDGYHITIGLKDRIKDQLCRAYALGFFHGEDGGEDGVREPRGDSPDSPPAGKPGVPGEGTTVVASANPGDPTRDWPYKIVRDQILVSRWLEVPDGTPLWEFLDEISGKKG